jgi:hypothetical protein
MRGSYLHSELHYTIFRLVGIYTFIKCHQNLQNIHKNEIVGLLSNTDRKLSKFRHISFFVDGLIYCDDTFIMCSVPEVHEKHTGFSCLSAYLKYRDIILSHLDTTPNLHL